MKLTPELRLLMAEIVAGIFKSREYINTYRKLDMPGNIERLERHISESVVQLAECMRLAEMGQKAELALWEHIAPAVESRIAA